MSWTHARASDIEEQGMANGKWYVIHNATLASQQLHDYYLRIRFRLEHRVQLHRDRMGSLPFWFRQFQVLVTKNRRLILRRPVHLIVLLVSSVASVVFAWLAGRDQNGPSGDFPPLTECGLVDGG